MFAKKLKTMKRITEDELMIVGKNGDMRQKCSVIAFREQLVGDFSEIQFNQNGWLIIDFKDRALYKSDYYFTVNVDKPSNTLEDGTKKDNIFDYVKNTGKPYMVCELSAFRQNSYKDQDPDNWYFTLGWFHFLRQGYFYNNNCPNDRWTKIKKQQDLKVDRWLVETRPKDYALICLQKVNDSTMTPLHEVHGKYKNWLLLVCNQIRNTYPKLPIVVRPHLRTKEVNYEGVVTPMHKCTISETWEDRTYFEGGDGLHEDFKGARFVVAYNSNVLTQSSLRGIPSICWDIRSAAAPGCLDPSQIGNLEAVHEIDRDTWLNNLSYTQWSRAEIRDGRAWTHLKKYGF